MSTKRAVDFDSAAERSERPKPTNRVPTPYERQEAHGVGDSDLSFTPDQTTRKHETAATKDSIAAGATKPGDIGDDRSVFYETGAESAERRAAHVLAKRKETADLFAANRKASSIVRKK
jgi:hypothetical protein